MKYSQRIHELESRLWQLRKHFLPSNFSKTGNYKDITLDRARAYRLLAHAEIESYIEDISRKIMSSNLKLWSDKGVPSSVIISLLASYHSGWIEFDETNNHSIIQFAKTRTKNTKLEIEDIIKKAGTQYLHNVKNNHGIRENNLAILLKPLGVVLTKLDQAWLAEIDSFGQLRGETAHSSKATTLNLINPSDEYQRVKDILVGLKTLDILLRSSKGSTP